MDAVKAAVLDTMLLQVEGGAAYKVEFPVSAVIAAEAKVGHSLRSFKDWWSMPAKDVAPVLLAGIQKHHPEATEADVQAICDALNPESLEEVQYALCKLAWPRVMAKIEESTAKIRDGGSLPNG